MIFDGEKIFLLTFMENNRRCQKSLNKTKKKKKKQKTKFPKTEIV